MEIKTVIFILLNLILIETILSVSKAFIIGVVLSGMPQELRKKRFYIALLSICFIRVLSLIFVSFLITTPYLMAMCMILCGGLIYYVLIDLKRYRKSSFLVLLMLLVALFSLEISETTNYESVYPAVAFTTNIYLIVVGVVIGFLFYSYMVFVVMKWGVRVSLVRYFGYIMLFIIALRSTFYLMLRILGEYWYRMDHRIELFLSIASLIMIIATVLYYKFRKTL